MTSIVTYGSGGYTCSGCGLWVSIGVGHVCFGCNYVQSITRPQTWSEPMSLKTFKGSVKLSDLPKDAAIGDGYFVKDLDALMIRVTDGWLFKSCDD